jgi:hypothetical protein
MRRKLHDVLCVLLAAQFIINASVKADMKIRPG